jgi:ribosome modulation factor
MKENRRDRMEKEKSGGYKEKCIYFFELLSLF